MLPTRSASASHLNYRWSQDRDLSDSHNKNPYDTGHITWPICYRLIFSFFVWVKNVTNITTCHLYVQKMMILWNYEKNCYFLSLSIWIKLLLALFEIGYFFLSSSLWLKSLWLKSLTMANSRTERYRMKYVEFQCSYFLLWNSIDFAACIYLEN